MERRTHPLSKADFSLLQHELDVWQHQQTAAIKAAGLQPQEEQAALQLLLAKETRLLQTLDRLRVNAHHETKARDTQQQLGSLAAPKTWPLRNGKKVRQALNCGTGNSHWKQQQPEVWVWRNLSPLTTGCACHCRCCTCLPRCWCTRR